MTEEQKQPLINWLEEGIELREEYGFNGNLLVSMRVALAALAALTPPPVKLPDISAGKYYTEEGSFMAFDYKRDLKESIRAAGYEVQE